jgi:hypothetical protein
MHQEVSLLNSGNFVFDHTGFALFFQAANCTDHRLYPKAGHVGYLLAGIEHLEFFILGNAGLGFEIIN